MEELYRGWEPDVTLVDIEKILTPEPVFIGLEQKAEVAPLDCNKDPLEILVEVEPEGTRYVDSDTVYTTEEDVNQSDVKTESKVEVQHNELSIWSPYDGDYETTVQSERGFDADAHVSECVAQEDSVRLQGAVPCLQNICPHCSKGYADPISFDDHLATHCCCCAECGSVFPSDKALQLHVNTHCDVGQWCCELCNKSFKQKCSLVDHMAEHAGIRSYFCQFCGRPFQHRGHLRVHLRRHTGERPYGCEHCGKGFMQRNHITEHLKVHAGKRPYACDHCGKTFTLKSNLSCHVRMHSGEKPYTCDQCSRTFVYKSQLAHHVTIHTGIRPHACQQCGKCFVRRSHLVDHLKSHTGDKPFRCQLCGTLFGLKSNLRAHIGRHNLSDCVASSSNKDVSFSVKLEPLVG